MLIKRLNTLLADLSSRLPELEWKISKLSTFSAQILPMGLFKLRFGISAKDCVDEIKSDILALTQQENPCRATYIAEQIQQKINVLVRICQIQGKKSIPQEKKPFGIDSLSSRQQWIQDLEKDIETLSLQQQAMVKTLEQMKFSSNVLGLLSAQTELGEIEKRLTLAKERFNQSLA